jgi:hypothetical protein
MKDMADNLTEAEKALARILAEVDEYEAAYNRWRIDLLTQEALYDWFPALAADRKESEGRVNTLLEALREAGFEVGHGR